MTIEDRIDSLAAPAFRAFLEADRAVRTAIHGGDAAAVDRAREASMLAARQATAELHRLSDAADIERPSWLPSDVQGPGPVRKWVQERYWCALRRGPCGDLDLLDDIENAFKHVALRPTKVPRKVVSDRAIIGVETGFGGGGYGEGVYGGAEQMIVTTTEGKRRALSAILRNNLHAWTLAVGRDLSAIQQSLTTCEFRATSWWLIAGQRRCSGDEL